MSRTHLDRFVCQNVDFYFREEVKYDGTELAHGAVCSHVGFCEEILSIREECATTSHRSSRCQAISYSNTITKLMIGLCSCEIKFSRMFSEVGRLNVGRLLLIHGQLLRRLNNPFLAKSVFTKRLTLVWVANFHRLAKFDAKPLTSEILTVAANTKSVVKKTVKICITCAY